MAAKKAESVSLKSIAKSVESAVKIAAARFDLVVEKDNLIDRWEIFGRRLRNTSDLNMAYQLAESITRGVKIPGLKAEPVASRIGKNILVGFIDRGGMSKILNR
jgi:hypothetical protein